MEPIFAGSFTDICQYTVNALLRNYINYSPDNVLDTVRDIFIGKVSTRKARWSRSENGS